MNDSPEALSAEELSGVETRMIGWKVLTHDYRPPVQGGSPLFTTLPESWVSPVVSVDLSAKECGVGWNFCRSAATAFRIAGLWPNGRPSTLFAVTDAEHLVERADKCRAASISMRPATATECADAIWEHCQSFGTHQRAMADAVWAWGRALGRRDPQPSRIESDLTACLKARGLPWSLKRYPAARDAWDAWDARDAWAALTWRFAALNGWVTGSPDKYDGLRDAYLHGLAIALPTGPDELGYSL